MKLAWDAKQALVSHPKNTKPDPINPHCIRVQVA